MSDCSGILFFAIARRGGQWQKKDIAESAALPLPIAQMRGGAGGTRPKKASKMKTSAGHSCFDNMAYPSEKLIQALLRTADNIEQGSPYQWGHMGACNCGNLAQVLTPYNKAEIHRFALEGHGDWNEQLRDYCGVTKLPLDVIIGMMLQEGLHTTDLMHLELLSDPEVLAQLPSERRHLKKQVKADVVLYFRTWAAMLQQQLNKMPQAQPTRELIAN